MTYTFDYISKGLRGMIEPATLRSHKFDETLGYRTFTNVYVAPFSDWEESIGCILDESGQIIKDSGCIEWIENAAFYNINDSLHEHKKVIFLGFILTGFGHSYTDDLRKLWFLKTDDYKALIQDGFEPVYTTTLNQPIPQAVLDVFSLAGVGLGNARLITTLTQFDEVIVPDNCYRATPYGRVYCQEYIDLIDCIKSAVPCSKDSIPRVYFTRSAFSSKTHKDLGEKDIEKVFRKRGYTIIIPENHSVIEQIQMVRDCDHFAATEGSVSHLSLFCKPHTDVIIINKANYLNFHQVMVNEFADLDVTYIEAHHSSMANEEYPWWGPFYLYATRYLERFVRHPILHIPYWARFSYWAYRGNSLYKFISTIRDAVYRCLPCSPRCR